MDAELNISIGQYSLAGRSLGTPELDEASRLLKVSEKQYTLVNSNSPASMKLQTVRIVETKYKKCKLPKVICSY